MYLNCKTFFSFRYGTFRTEELVKAGAEIGARALAITNINNTCDAWDFYEHCLQKQIRPVLGTEIRNGDDFCYILLAKDLAGFGAINAFLSEHLQQKLCFPERPQLPSNVWIIYPLGRFEPAVLGDNELIGVQPAEITRLYGTNVDANPLKFVIRHAVSFQDKKHFNLHRLLRAIDKNVVLSRQQSSETGSPADCFLPPDRLRQIFESYPLIISNTLDVLDSCVTNIDFGVHRNKRQFTASAGDDRELLRKLAMEGLTYRYGNNAEAAARVSKELQIIDELGFNAYFLITWDVVRYAQSRGFFYVGRGSGANSIVAYCLQITDVDPIELDLYFERFLNPYRKAPPDFDIDFSWRDRDEVIDYVFKRYGREHVVLLGMYTTFQRSAIFRELAKVFGLPKSEADSLVENASAVLKDDAYHKYIVEYGAMMEDFPNHLSIHPGGMLISEEPICRYSAAELPPKGFATSQIDMFAAEKLGLHKIDILGQRGLGHIKDAMQLVRQNTGVNIDIHAVETFKKDEKVAAQIRAADTTGCFYIESPGMRQVLKKLRCDDYITLVAASSIIRPGVAQSGMMRQFIYRYNNPHDFEYLHPKMKELLEETYGVMVYQEDVIKVAHHFAGLDMGEADILRRAMSGKYRTRKEFVRIREKFFRNCKAYGYPDALTAEVWRQIESFGGYSFSKAHSASFAVESYQSLFLKTYYPMEFMVAVINNFGGFYNTELYFHELKKTGARVLPPCVNKSEYYTGIEGTNVYMGLVHIQGMEENMAFRVLEERGQNGEYLHLQDFIERTAITLEQLNILVRTGALRFTGKSKKELLWEANFLQKRNKRQIPAHASMFPPERVEFRLPQLKQHPLDDALDEIELLGFSLCNIWELVNADTKDFLSAAALPAHIGRTVEVIGYYVVTKEVRTVRRDTMHFASLLDKDGNWLDTVHFPETVKQFPLQGKGFYRMRGKVVEEFGVYSVEVNQCIKIGIKTREPV